MAAAERSVTHTVMIFVSLVVGCAGLVIAALGLGGVTGVEANLFGVEVETVSVGLWICVMGFAFAANVALNLQAYGTVRSDVVPRWRRIADQVAWPVVSGLLYVPHMRFLEHGSWRDSLLNSLILVVVLSLMNVGHSYWEKRSKRSSRTPQL